MLLMGSKTKMGPRTTLGTETRAPRSPLTYLALTAGLTVPFWLIGALIETPEGSPVQLPTSALALVCPVAAASILVARDEGLRGARGLLRRSVSLRGIEPRWFLPILALPPIAYLGAYGAMRLAGQERPGSSVTLVDLAVLAAIFVVAGVAEEAGWTGYATEPLRDRWGALPAAVVIGAVWGLVHVVPDLQGGQDANWIFWQRVVGSIALRILIVWLFVNTGSVGAAVLFHAVENLSWQALASTGPYEPWFVAPTFALMAALVVALWGPQTLDRFRFGGGSLSPSTSPT
jgi:membrane protease YdiL (CAAX protease family)